MLLLKPKLIRVNIRMLKEYLVLFFKDCGLYLVVRSIKKISEVFNGGAKSIDVV